MLLLTREYTIHRQLILLVVANIACHKQTQSKVIQFANGQRGWSGDALLPQPHPLPPFSQELSQSVEFQPSKFHHLAKSPLVAPFPRVDIYVFSKYAIISGLNKTADGLFSEIYINPRY